MPKSKRPAQDDIVVSGSPWPSEAMTDDEAVAEWHRRLLALIAKLEAQRDAASQASDAEAAAALEDQIASLSQYGPEDAAQALAESRPREHEIDLIDGGREAFRRSIGAGKQWMREKLGRTPSVESQAAAAEILRSHEPPNAYRVRSLGPDRQWVEHPRPPFRRTAAFWRKRLRDPVAYLNKIVSLRISSRRIDARRAASRAKRKRIALEEAERSHGDTGLVTTAAVADDQDETLQLAGLIAAAEACGVGLSPFEREVIQRWYQGERYVDIAADLGKDDGQVRGVAWRARRKLREAGRVSL
jgi:DNA-directed RNA polymerase specialized sigma24 family protein